MKQLVDKYAQKMVRSGLVGETSALVGGMDAEIVWNRRDSRCAELEKLFQWLDINSLVFAQPQEPYRSIIHYLARHARGQIEPHDCETRTFMRDLPVVKEFDASMMASALRQRKSVIVQDQGVAAWGMVSPEQAFIYFSSVCFACFVKFFFDYLVDYRLGVLTKEAERVFETVIPYLDALPEKPPLLMQGPFTNRQQTLQAMIQAGAKTVEYKLVDSFFGNISYKLGDLLYISQTGSSLDELERCIDACPLDGSSCAALTASSEFTAHRQALLGSGINAILHGHPKFTVILSMQCEKNSCDLKGQCHIRCHEKRFIRDIPIVPGEVGVGPFGLCHTLPKAMEGRRGAIVYGHGLFASGQSDYNQAFATLLDVENTCRQLYLEFVS